MLRIVRPLPSFLVCALLMLPAFAPKAFAQTVYFVGPASDTHCNYHTIQAAVNAWAASPSTDFVTIYIAKSQTYGATAITIPTPTASSGLSLTGGYPGCQVQGAAGRTVVDGTGNGNVPVFAVEGTVAGDEKRMQVTLGQLDISGGHFVGGNGGGVRLRGNAVLTLFETKIHGNTATNGAGVAVEATAAGIPNLLMVGNHVPMQIEDNNATQDGGGLYCSNATLYCDRYCRIAGNTAGRNGGAVAQQQCQTSIFPPPSFGFTDPDVGLRSNSALGDGGAAWVSGGYFSIGGAPPVRPGPVIGNTAGGSGGALYFTGLGSSSNVHHGVQFDNNHAGGDGGALFADSGFLQLDAGITGLGCSDISGCARFQGNHADGVGGAIALSGNAQALVYNEMFTNNDAARASVLQISATGTGATLINVHVAGNHGATELLRSSGGYVDLRYVTIADNGGDDDALIRFDAPGSLAAQNSVLYDFNGAASGIVVSTVSGTTYSINCVLVHDDSGLDGAPGVTNLVSADPQWDTSGLYPAGLYVPGPNSPAVDAFDALRGLAVATMLLVNDPGDWSHIYAPLEHAEWNGCTFADFVFPVFLFIVGVSIALAQRGPLNASGRHAAVRAILARALRIVVLGIVLNLVAEWTIAGRSFRLFGVLQRIGLCYAAVALCALYLRPTLQWAFVVSLLIGYWALLAITGPLLPNTNLVDHVDTLLLHQYAYAYDVSTGLARDPEGVLSTLPAIATTLLGLRAGCWLRAGETRRIVIAGVIALVLGALWSQVLPLNKQLWTSSFVLWTAAAALFALAVAHTLIDRRAWPALGRTFGTNAIVAYAGAWVMTCLLEVSGGHAAIYRIVFAEPLARHFGPFVPSLAYAIAFMLVCWLALRGLARIGWRITI